MKKTVNTVLAAAAMTLAGGCMCFVVGCTTAEIKTAEWSATMRSHWLKRDVDKLSVNRLADGSYSVDLNGYRTDASEQFPAFTREMWNGAVTLGRIAAAAYNPAVSGVPLTAEAADGGNMDQIINASANAQAKLMKAQAELAALKAELKAGSAATNASLCQDGSCSPK